MAKPSAVEEVLQWGDERKSITAVVSKLQNLKREVDQSKEETQRYKKDLQRFLSDHEAHIRKKNEKIEQMEDTVNLSHKEIAKFSLLQNELAEAKSSLKAKDAKIAEMENMLNTLINNNQSLTKSVESFKNGKTEHTGMERGALHARFHDISKMKSDENHKSKPVRIAGTDWSIVVGAHRNAHGEKYLSVYLDVVSKITDTWMCAVRTKTHLISQNGGVTETEVDKELNIFCKERKDHGYEKFINFKELLKSKNGFVKNDSIVVIIEMKCVMKSE